MTASAAYRELVALMATYLSDVSIEATLGTVLAKMGLQALRRKLDAARGRGGAAEILQLTGRTRRRAQWVHAQGRWVVSALGGRVGAEGGDEAPETAAAAAARIKAAGIGEAETAEWLAWVEPAFRKLDRLLARTDKLEPTADKLRFNRDLACAEFDHVARQLDDLRSSTAAAAGGGWSLRVAVEMNSALS